MRNGLAKIGYHSITLFFVMSLCFGFAGCGVSPQPQNMTAEGQGISVESKDMSDEISERTDWQGTYRVQELGWADADLCMQKVVDDNRLLFPENYVLSGDTVWRRVVTLDEDYQNQRDYLQKLEAPYKEWTVMEVPTGLTEDGKRYGLSGYLYYQGNPVYATMIDMEPESNQYYLASCNEKGEVQKILGAMPQMFNPSTGYTLIVEELQHIYAYNTTDGKVVFLTPDMQIEKEFSPRRKLQGMFVDVANDQVYLREHDEKGFCICDTENELIVQDAEKFWSYYYLADVLSDGKIVACDSQQLWQCEKGETPQLLCDFTMNDYPFEDLYEMEVQSDDSIILMAKLDGEYCLARVLPRAEGETSEKQELVIAFGYKHLALLKSISRFNRQSDLYHITAIMKEEDETMEDYGRAIQLEMSAGRGPDIMIDDFISDTSGYITNGYFASLDDVLNKEEDYLQSAFVGGRTDGILYGMPYDFTLRFVSYSKDFTGDRDFWTLPEFMKAVEASEAKTLMRGCDEMDIIMWYGLYDNSNTQYIDWEKGESHLTEQPFLELLKFAAKYADKEKVSREEEGEILRNKSAVSTLSEMIDLREMENLDSCWEGEAAILGYPRSDQRGVYIQSRYLYVNSNSASLEGVKEFLRFLLSTEEQEKYIKMNMEGSFFGYCPYLPVNLEAFEYLIECESNLTNKEKKNLSINGRGGSFSRSGLSEEQINTLRNLVNNALPDNFYAKELYSMVAEELQTYFDGQKSAEEVADILDNRVQLYLDEMND